MSTNELSFEWRFAGGSIVAQDMSASYRVDSNFKIACVVVSKSAYIVEQTTGQKSSP